MFPDGLPTALLTELLSHSTEPVLVSLTARVKSLSQHRLPVLLLGCEGNGQFVIASMIHRFCDRSGPFVSIDGDVASLDQMRAAWLAADGGSLLIERLDQTPLGLQSWLVGQLSNENRQMDTGAGAGQVYQTNSPRVLATAASDITEIRRLHKLDDRLFWHFYGLTVQLPGLAELKTELPRLFQAGVNYWSGQLGLAIGSGLVDQWQAAVADHHWPGGLRELSSVARTAVVLGHLEIMDFDVHGGKAADQKPVSLRQAASATSSPAELDSADLGDLIAAVVRQGAVAADKAHHNLYDFVVHRIEKALISTVLEQCQQVQTKAAARLGINRNTLHKKMKDFGLE